MRYITTAAPGEWQRNRLQSTVSSYLHRSLGIEYISKHPLPLGTNRKVHSGICDTKLSESNLDIIFLAFSSELQLVKAWSWLLPSILAIFQTQVAYIHYFNTQS